MTNSGHFTCSGNQDSLKDITEKQHSPVCILGTRLLATDVKDGLDEGGGDRRACLEKMAESKWVTNSDGRIERQARTGQCSVSRAHTHSPGHCDLHTPAGCGTKNAFQPASPEQIAQQQQVRPAGEQTRP